MKKKYMFFDIDGTLTDNATKEIVPSAQKTLDSLQEAGHFVAIATGRAHYKARGFMEAVGLHNMVCCGAVSYTHLDVYKRQAVCLALPEPKQPDSRFQSGMDTVFEKRSKEPVSQAAGYRYSEA